MESNLEKNKENNMGADVQFSDLVALGGVDHGEQVRHVLPPW